MIARLFGATAILMVVLGASQAATQSEADRLREALRRAIGELRASEDQRVGLQARLAQAESQRQVALQENVRLKAQLKKAQSDLKQAVDDFNARLAERDATLEKWKDAYAEAAEVARTRDAERIKFQDEATTFKSRNTVCETKNVKLLKIDKEILAGYRDLNLFEKGAIQEPLFGFARVDHQNKAQDFRNRILDEDVKVPAPSPEVPSQPAKQQGAAAAGREKSAEKASSAKTNESKSNENKINAKSNGKTPANKGNQP